MIQLFKKIRKQLLTKSKLSTYSLYAIGEIVLVVIGILIALAINNNNEVKKTKIKELNYLLGIKSDLQLNLIELKTFITTREKSVNSAEKMLYFFKKNEEINPNEFNFHNLQVQIWLPFKKNDNTYQELINSGNLTIISNKSIKNILINTQLGYKQIKILEIQMQHDFDNYMYPVYFKITDLESDLLNYTFQMSKGTEGVKAEISREKMELLLNSQTFKNGFVLSIYNNKSLITEYQKIILMTEKLITLIDIEFEKN